MGLLPAPQHQRLTMVEAMAPHHTRRAMDTNPEQELASDLGKEGYVLGLLLVCSSAENSSSLGLVNLLLVL